MKILAFGDLLGRTEIVKKILRLKLKDFDLLIYTGDTPDPSVFKAIRETRVLRGINKNTNIEKELIKETTPYKALKKATKEVSDICLLLNKVPIPFYGALGNADLQYYSQFVNWPFTLLHNKVIKIKDYNLVGYNGRPLYQFEQENKNENAFAETKVKKDLEKIFNKINPKKTILITHSPPFGILDQVEEKMRSYAIGTYGKKAKDGHIGSYGLKKITEKYRPFIHIFSHIHESRGKIVKGKTTFVNIGSAGETREVCKINIINSNIKVSFISIK